MTERPARRRVFNALVEPLAGGLVLPAQAREMLSDLKVEMLREEAACETAACGTYIGPKPYPPDGWVFVQINGHDKMEPGGWYHCVACAIAALRAAEARRIAEKEG